MSDGRRASPALTLPCPPAAAVIAPRCVCAFPDQCVYSRHIVVRLSQCPLNDEYVPVDCDEPDDEHDGQRQHGGLEHANQAAARARHQ